jgi:hypothetical protein
MIALQDRYKIASIIDWGAHLGGHVIQAQECSTNLSTGGEYNFQGVAWNVHETILR